MRYPTAGRSGGGGAVWGGGGSGTPMAGSGAAARPGGGARQGAATVARRRDAAGGGGGGPAAGSGTWQGGGGTPPRSGVPAAGSDSRMVRVVMAGVAGDGRTTRAEGRRMRDGRTPASRLIRVAPCSGPTRQWLAPAMLATGPRG
nr:glycine-rich cell wall structural protein 2-like [Oryza sativa Japonica Group]